MFLPDDGKSRFPVLHAVAVTAMAAATPLAVPPALWQRPR